jgi:predicted esterase
MASTLSFLDLGRPFGEAEQRIFALGDGTHAAKDWACELAPHFALRVLEAPRRADPRRHGVASRAGDWYVEGAQGPDPHAFHLSLAALEDCVLACAGGRLCLLGVGQGAVLCLSLACCWPERLAAVVACAGGLPSFPPGGLEERPLNGLPLLCIGRATASARALEARGGQVSERADWNPQHAVAWLPVATRERPHLAP